MDKPEMDGKEMSETEVLLEKRYTIMDEYLGRTIEVLICAS